MSDKGRRASDSTEATGVRSVRGYRGGTIMPFTPETAAAANRARWEKKNRAIRVGVALAGEQMADLPRPGALGVLARAAEQHALNAVDPSARGSAASLRLILDHGWPEPPRSVLADGASGVTVYISGDIAAAALAALRGNRQDELEEL